MRRPRLTVQASAALIACELLFTLTTRAVHADAVGQASPVATPPPIDGVPSDLIAAQQLLHAAYPDLVGAMSVRTVPGQVLVRVDESGSPLLSSPRSSAEPLLTAVVSFDEAGLLAQFSADGRFVHAADSAALDAAVRAHAPWTASDALRWVLTRGARPAAEVRARARLTGAWQRWLGTITTSPDAEWQLPRTAALTDAQAHASTVAPAVAAHTLRDRAGWVTQVVAGGHTYRVTFEPFEGRLIQVVRQ
jgi:hypothetical protein